MCFELGACYPEESPLKIDSQEFKEVLQVTIKLGEAFEEDSKVRVSSFWGKLYVERSPLIGLKEILLLKL